MSHLARTGNFIDKGARAGNCNDSALVPQWQGAYICHITAMHVQVVMTPGVSCTFMHIAARLPVLNKVFRHKEMLRNWNDSCMPCICNSRTTNLDFGWTRTRRRPAGFDPWRGAGLDRSGMHTATKEKAQRHASSKLTGSHVFCFSYHWVLLRFAWLPTMPD